MTSTYLLACSGNSFSLPQTSEKFEQVYTYNNKVDILWVIDNSASMLQHQQHLSDEIPAIVEVLNAIKMDYHMAVVTSSMGGTNPTGGKFLGDPKFITPSTPDMINQLRSRLVPGQDGSNNERGLESMEKVLSSSYQSGEGRGFLRDDALLAVIVLSDEEDKSQSASSAVNHYKNFLDGIKKPWVDGSRSWVLNFIGVLSISSDCRTFNDYAEPGFIFMGLADISGGVKESICNVTLSQALSNIKARLFHIITDFRLSKKPIVESIIVKINDKVVSRSNVDGWDYVESINAVRFYGSAVPAADDKIVIDFKPEDAN